MHSDDPLAEMLGEEYVQAATSGEEAYSVDVDGVTAEEFGGPFSTFSVGQAAAKDSGDEPRVVHKSKATSRPKRARAK